MENLTAATPEQHMPPVPQTGIHVDERTLKRIAAGALRQMDGVLGLGSNMGDILKSGGDGEIAGIDVAKGSGNTVSVYAKVVTEYGKSIPQIVSGATANLAAAMENMAGATLDKVDIEVSDTMTADEYERMLAKHHGLA